MTRRTLIPLFVLLYVPHVLLKSVPEPSLADIHARLERKVAQLAKNTMMQQFHVEEVMRGTTNSGVRRVRMYEQGTRSYYASTHINDKYGPTHNHANNQRTLGWGEFIAVLNGNQFTTRHNDYRLVMKSTTSKEYGATEDIPFPDVPPEVSSLTNVSEQVAEMKEWFRAWANEDDSERDYKKYFRPAICVLEGRWTKSDPDTIQEPFYSDRHFLDAKSWSDLQQKVRFSQYAGAKDRLENYAYFPTIIWEVNGTKPIMAQWNMQIVCHPIKNYLPKSRLRPIDYLKARISLGYSFEEYVRSRAVGFVLAVYDQDQWVDGKSEYVMLDDIMAEVPGPDNYLGNITDDFMDDIAYPYNSKDDTPLNVANYIRVWRSKKKDMMGLTQRRHGFNDETQFVAQTTQEQVMGLPVTICDKKNGTNCKKWFQRWSYAVPLEFIYLTPLTNWNPYNLPFRGEADTDEGKTVLIGPDGKESRDGTATLETCFNGINSKTFYMTPTAFFDGEVDPDPADTTQDSVCVLDENGEMHMVKASGHRIILPNIPGVGSLRQRFPSEPWDEEGRGVWKELDSLKDTFLYPDKYSWMVPSDPIRDYLPGAQRIVFVVQPSSEKYRLHTHEVLLNNAASANYLNGDVVKVETKVGDGHQHILNIKKNGTFDVIVNCDGEETCWDEHPSILLRET